MVQFSSAIEDHSFFMVLFLGQTQDFVFLQGNYNMPEALDMALGKWSGEKLWQNT